MVGGSVRDRELGRYSPDLDLAVADDAAAVAREIAGTLKVPWFVLSERHPAYRVMGREGHVDVAALRGAGIADDLAERDFTVNAMAVSLDGSEVVDPFDGLTHLRQGRLVAVSERIFEDDPLRLMRAVRFAHILGLVPDAALMRSIRMQAPLLVRAAAERVATEMTLTLAEGRAAEAVRLWRDLGVLEVALPEVVAAERLAPTLALLERLDDLLTRPAVWFPATAVPLVERLARPADGAVNRPVALRLAGLLHRLAPAEVETTARRLKLSGEMLSLLRTVSRHYSEGGALPAAPTRRPAVLFLWATAPWEPEVILLEAATVVEGAAADDPSSMGLILGPARRMMALWAERAIHGVPRPPLDGEALMRELELESGPLVGTALRAVHLAWEAGEAATYDALLTVARSTLS